MTAQECHEAVTPDWADGDEMPCNADAIAMRLDEEGGMYPVCIDHVRAPMAPLVRPAAQDAPAAPPAGVGTSDAGNGAQGGAHATGPDPDGGVEFTDEEWAAFRGKVSLGNALRHIRDVEGPYLAGWDVLALADRADALEEERDAWRDTASRVDGEFGRVKRERDSARELLAARDAQVERVRGRADTWDRTHATGEDWYASDVRAALDGTQ